MYIQDEEHARSFVGTIVYQSHRPEKLYRIKSYEGKSSNNVMYMFLIENEYGETGITSDCVITPISDLIEGIETTLNNHKKRLNDFLSKMDD